MARCLKRVPVRLVAPDDIHLTLVPPWSEVSSPKAVETLRRVIDGFDPFVLTSQHISYGPDPKRPRLLWAACAGGHEIAELRAVIVRLDRRGLAWINVKKIRRLNGLHAS